MRNLSEEHLNEKKKKGFVPFQKGVNPFAKKEKNSEEDEDDSKDDSKGSSKSGNPFAKGGSLYAKGHSAKKKKKIGKMKVACEKCNTPISNLTESRDQFRLKLRGFCESCNKFKVAYINDMNAIAASGKRFDYLVKENLPAGVAQPGLPANANSQQQKPAAPGTTTAPAPTPAPNSAQLLQKPEVQAAASAFAKMIGHTTDDLHQMLTTNKNLTNTPPAAAPAPATTAPAASAAPTGQVPPTTQAPR